MREAAEHPFWASHDPILSAANLRPSTSAFPASPKRAAAEEAVKQRQINHNIVLLNEVALKATSPTSGNLSPSVRNNLSEAKVSSLKKEFVRFSDGKGEIASVDNFIAFLKETDLLALLNLTEASAQNLLWKMLDFDESGAVSKLELFAGLVVLLAPFASTKTRLGLLFLAMDEDDSETISAQEFTNVYSLFGVDNVTAAVIFHSLDKNHDGSLSLDEFLEGAHAIPEPSSSFEYNL